MKFDKYGIAKIPKESSRGLSLGLLTALGAGMLGNALLDLTRVTNRTNGVLDDLRIYDAKI